jgi:hypothetical protein
VKDEDGHLLQLRRSSEIKAQPINKAVKEVAQNNPRSPLTTFGASIPDSPPPYSKIKGFNKQAEHNLHVVARYVKRLATNEESHVNKFRMIASRVNVSMEQWA